MKKFSLLFLFTSCLFNAQILDKFPNGQNFYQGGISNLYSDMHQIIADKKYEKCANPKEFYLLKLLVTKESEIKFVKDFDSVNIAQNQCAYDLARNLAINLKNKKWFPAIVKDQKFSSIVELPIYPNDLFENYRNGYTPFQFYVPPSFKIGEEKGRRKFHNTFQSLFEDYEIVGRFYLEFYVGTDGEISDPSLKPEVTNQIFPKEVYRTLKRLDKQWIPATFQGVPVKSKIVVPLSFTEEFYEK